MRDDTLSLLRLDVQQGVTTVLERAAAVWASAQRMDVISFDPGTP